MQAQQMGQQSRCATLCSPTGTARLCPSTQINLNNTVPSALHLGRSQPNRAFSHNCQAECTLLSVQGCSHRSDLIYSDLIWLHRRSQDDSLSASELKAQHASKSKHAAALTAEALGSVMCLLEACLNKPAHGHPRAGCD